MFAMNPRGSGRGAAGVLGVLMIAAAAKVQACPLPSVTGVFASDGILCNGVQVTWNAVPEATGYRVFRTGGGPMTTVDVTTTHHFDSVALPGTSYQYVVAARSAACPNPSMPAAGGDTGSAAIFEVIVVTPASLARPAAPFEFYASVEGELASGATYRWLRNGVPLVDGGRISGSQTQRLRINSARYEDSDLYSVEITTTLGTRTVDTAMVVKNAQCPGDINGGGLGVQDLFDFLALFFAGCP